MSEQSWNNLADKSVWKRDRNHFEESVLPHLNAAYNLARWLTGNKEDAEDVVQESYLRAWHSFGSFHVGGNGRAWLLKIVRNTCHTWMRKNRSRELVISSQEGASDAAAAGLDPEAACLRKANSERIRQAIENVPFIYREALILRELEGFSYKEIALIIDAPLGTVMSRLSRAREELHASLCEVAPETKT